VSTHILQAPVFLVVDAARVSDIRVCGCRVYAIPRVYMSVAVVPPSRGSSSTQLCRHGSPQCIHLVVLQVHSFCRHGSPSAYISRLLQVHIVVGTVPLSVYISWFSKYTAFVGTVPQVHTSRGSSSTQRCRNGSPQCIGHVGDVIVLLKYISICAIRVHSYAAVVCTCDRCIPVLELQPVIITNIP
jgi:hypothetical protein